MRPPPTGSERTERGWSGAELMQVDDRKFAAVKDITEGGLVPADAARALIAPTESNDARPANAIFAIISVPFYG